MQRVYFPHTELEECRDGMWKVVGGSTKQRNLEASANLMRDTAAFEAAMCDVFDAWPNSCQHNLTAEDTNRLAWLGHAGCFLAVGSPEENTRCGWHTLTPEEQNAANAAAQRALDAWLDANADYPLLLKMMGLGNA
jgi:hypothetical protein